MKQLVMTVIFALVFGLAALAQTATPADPQSNPSAQPAQSSTATSSQSQTAAPSSAKETHLKGCLQSENGKFMLRDKSGRTVELTGQDLSAHQRQFGKSACRNRNPFSLQQQRANQCDEDRQGLRHLRDEKIVMLSRVRLTPGPRKGALHVSSHRISRPESSR